MNAKVLNNFITFLSRGRTHGFDSEQRCYDQLKLIELTRYNFQFESIVSFGFNFCCLNGFQRSSYSCTCKCKIMTNTSPICSSQKEKLANI
jgi:hypothetical protein